MAGSSAVYRLVHRKIRLTRVVDLLYQRVDPNLVLVMGPFCAAIESEEGSPSSMISATNRLFPAR